MSLLLFLVVMERRLWPTDPWITSLLAIFVLVPPAVRDWAINLHGHAYTSSYILLGLCLGLTADKGRFGLWRVGVAFALGFLSNYMLLTAAFVVCAAPLTGSLLNPGRPNHVRAVLLTGAVGLGLVASFGVHYVQIVNQFGWAEARLDQLGVLTVRSGAGGPGASAWELAEQYQADVTRFFGLSPLIMLLTGGWLALCHPGSRRERLNLMLAVTVAGAASWAWILVLRQHSVQHGHVNPRVFFLSYVCMLICAGTLAGARRLRHSPL